MAVLVVDDVPRESPVARVWAERGEERNHLGVQLPHERDKDEHEGEERDEAGVHGGSEDGGEAREGVAGESDGGGIDVPV